MKQRFHLLTILVIIFFLAAAYANMHLNEPKENPSPTLSDQAPDPDNRTTKTIDINRGKLLYDNHCSSCHNERIHSKNSSKVRSVGDIRQRVIRWSSYQQLQWEKSDIDMVTDYLNTNYYHFPSSE